MGRTNSVPNPWGFPWKETSHPWPQRPVTADLGIILQLPAPIIIALIGQLSATFPKPEAAIVVLHIDILGVLDTGEKRLSISASLRDSRVGPFALTGDMELRLHWGAESDFALSIGGFNPTFKPPPNFPTLRRLALSLGSGSNPRISLSAYFALTPNSLQVGARAEMVWSAREHFIRHVRGRGPLPALRVGAVPYGILPVTSLTRWAVPATDGWAQLRSVWQKTSIA